MNKWTLVVLSAPALAGLGWMAVAGPPRRAAFVAAPPSAIVATVPKPSAAPVDPSGVFEVASAAPTPVAPVAPPAKPRWRGADPETPPDPEGMKALHTLLDESPAAAVIAAREGLRRYPSSPDAAERTWVVVKGLSVLGQHAEARDEARTMVQLFPSASWTNDVKRHVLTHPPSGPGE